jgi:hypothetical protein
MTLDELDYKLPDGFDDRKTDSMEVALLTGWPEDPEPDREQYQNRVLTYPFLPDGKPILVGEDPAKADHPPAVPALSTQYPGVSGATDFLYTTGGPSSILPDERRRSRGSEQNQNIHSTKKSVNSAGDDRRSLDWSARAC